MGEAEGGAPLARRPVGLQAACMGLQAACGGPAASSAAGGGATPRSGSVRTRCASADLIQVGVSDGAAALLLSPAGGRCGRACSAVLIQVGVSDGAAAALPLTSPLSPDSAEATALVAALPRC